jgi:hypothetical protein
MLEISTILKFITGTMANTHHRGQATKNKAYSKNVLNWISHFKTIPKRRRRN